MQTETASRTVVLAYASDPETKLGLNLGGLGPIPIRWIEQLPELISELSDVNPVSVVIAANCDNISTMRACYAIRQVSKAPLHLVSASLSEPEVELAKSLGVTTVHSPDTAPAVIVEFIWRFLAAGEPPKSGPQRTIKIRGLEVDLAKRIVRIDGAVISLTRIEFELLSILVKGAGSVVSRPELVGTVWGKNWFGVENVLDTHLTHLRRKIGVGGFKRAIVNVRGVGFYFEPENITDQGCLAAS